MKEKNNFYESLLLELSHLFDEIYKSGKNTVYTKEDKTPVTAIDLAFSDTIEKYFKSFTEYNDFNFYSEENHTKLDFPALIIDPIDGTRELSQGIAECAVSVGVMWKSDIDNKKNHAWIYNPFTSESIELTCLREGFREKGEQLLGLVSNTEWENQQFEIYSDIQKIKIKPLGSIAYKLLKLASNECDFVITMRNKNIWDIAGGTILLERKDIHLYGVNGRIKKLEEKTLIAPLLWCREEQYPELREIFFK